MSGKRLPWCQALPDAWTFAGIGTIPPFLHGILQFLLFFVFLFRLDLHPDSASSHILRLDCLLQVRHMRRYHPNHQDMDQNRSVHVLRVFILSHSLPFPCLYIQNQLT